MTLADILRNKGNNVLTIGPNATLDDVVQSLVQNNCGSLVVVEGNSNRRMLGIITERDILRACAAKKGPLDQIRVADVMSAKPITGLASDTIGAAMGLMTQKRIRHLPILQDGELVGMISIGDLVKTQHDQFAVENHYMKTYIQS
ncbi:MAG: CBS domain-containing protein [Pirellulales bacterium]